MRPPRSRAEDRTVKAEVQKFATCPKELEMALGKGARVFPSPFRKQSILGRKSTECSKNELLWQKDRCFFFQFISAIPLLFFFFLQITTLKDLNKT